MSVTGGQYGEYEEGDVNTVDTAYEAGDINTITDADEGREGDDTGAGGEAGNRVEGAMPVAVLTYLARALADEPDAVAVQTGQRHGAVRLQLHVAPDDMGRVIGRRGRTAQAIRILVGAAGAREGVETSVDIVDE